MHSQLGTDSIGSQWYNQLHFRNYFTNCSSYQLCWRRFWNCPPSLSILFWHLFIKFPMTRCSSPLLMLLISSRILCFSSSSVCGFVLYTAFFNLPQRYKSQGGHVGRTSRPLIPFLSFQNCAREKFSNFIFPHLINMGQFSNLYYECDSSIWLRSIEVCI